MSKTVSTCSFCSRDTFERQIVVETPSFFVLHARRPLSRGHCLIIPKNHASAGSGVESESAAEFIKLVNTVFSAVTTAFSSSGINFFANYGASAGQEIPHAHFHVVPRYPNESQSPFEKLQDPTFKATAPLATDAIEAEKNVIRKYIS